MKTTLSIAGGLGLVMVALWWLVRSGLAPAPADPLARAHEQPVAALAPAPRAAAAARAPHAEQHALPPTPSGPSADSRRPDGNFDPMLVMALGDFSDEEIARYNDLHILPFNRAVGQDCQQLPDPSLFNQSYTVCETVRERPEHPYSQLGTEALMELAVHDQVAALMLGRRVKREEERLYWYLRAAALSEKSGPLMSLAENRYNAPVKLQTVDGVQRAVAQPEQLAVRIALHTVAQKMGDPRAIPAYWQHRLRELAPRSTDIYLAQASSLTDEFLQTMAEIQRQITGSVQMQEIIDHG